jgi:ferredoxin-NADP reductase
MLQPWQTGMVIRIEQEAAQTRRFWIQLPALASFDFEPGQFVTLDLPIHDKPNKRWRSYSIASWPDGTNVIELVIVFLEGGAGTHYLFNEVKVGSQLTLRGPQGVFTLPEPVGKDLFLICTGTGVAPFRSMTHYICAWKHLPDLWLPDVRRLPVPYGADGIGGEDTRLSLYSYLFARDCPSFGIVFPNGLCACHL